MYLAISSPQFWISLESAPRGTIIHMLQKKILNSFLSFSHLLKTLINYSLSKLSLKLFLQQWLKIFSLRSWDYAKAPHERDTVSTLSGYFNSDRLRCTGAPVVCANVLQWAPSRVTRRGALAATAAAAAAAAAFPPFASPRLTFLLPLSPRIHTPALSSPSAVYNRHGPAGPLARRHPHHGVPWSRGRQPSPPQNTPSLFRLLPNGATDDTFLLPPFLRLLSFSVFPSIASSPTLSRYHFLFAVSFARSRPWRSCRYRYRSFRNLQHVFIVLFIWH